MRAPVLQLNLKQGMPTVAEARQRLNQTLQQARTSGVVAIKIIHGYGSSGVGGALREAIRRSLTKRRKEGSIRAFAAGEKWDSFEPTSQQILAEVPSLARDPDLNRYNEGITIVLL